ncbi:MAG: FAD-binding oxidoreductase [Akkermansiaceae bacterium]|nr:FAD-binding oxidoreductase [Akkermansiaceae bacterium]
MSGGPVIVGQGLAGTCVAWHLWWRGEPFSLLDREQGGASRVAAGLVNPVTGKNFEPSWRIAEFLPDALDFYARVERELGVTLWHPMTVLRLAASEKEWAKISSKLTEEKVKPWVGGVVDAPDGWVGAVEVTGGGRVDTRLFTDASRGFFRERGIYRKGDGATESTNVFCEGAAGLISGKYGPSRCAKGEILTVRADGWDESRIRVGGGGWMVPLGAGKFRAGATYEWDDLDEVPTEKGREFVEKIVCRLGGENFEVVDHVAGIRPILRRSEPLIGPLGDGNWMFNGLGSKGSLYAPAVADRLVKWMLDGVPCEADLSYPEFRTDG